MSSRKVKRQCGLSIKVVGLAVVERHHHAAYKVLVVYQNLVICRLQLRVNMYLAEMIPVSFPCLCKQECEIYIILEEYLSIFVN